MEILGSTINGCVNLIPRKKQKWPLENQKIYILPTKLLGKFQKEICRLKLESTINKCAQAINGGKAACELRGPIPMATHMCVYFHFVFEILKPFFSLFI